MNFFDKEKKCIPQNAVKIPLHLNQKEVEVTYKAYCTLAALTQDEENKNKCIELANKLIQD
jgi:hypothetical protein